MPHIKTIASPSVPYYNSKSEFPFAHLLAQTGIPYPQILGFHGPFRKGHRTIRSIHFAVPRSLPSSFSRGIRKLSLDKIHFQRSEDLMSLVSELPDLEGLWYDAVTFGSYPIELPRRPRKNRNSLRSFQSFACEGAAEENKELGYLLLALNPFLAVYNSVSFFDDNEVAVIRTLLQDVLLKGYHVGRLLGNYKYDTKSKSRLFGTFSLQTVLFYLSVQNVDIIHTDAERIIGKAMHVALRTRLDSTIIYYYTQQCITSTVGWSKVAAACRSLSQPLQFVIAADNRCDLLDFNANVVEKMPSLFRPGAVHYSLNPGKGWCLLTSLDSDKLEGVSCL